MPHSDSPKPDIVQDMNRVNKDGTYLNEVDLIFCLGLFDYVIHPDIAMLNIYDWLKPGGTAWVEFPFVYPIHNPVDDEGCRYSEGCIRRLVKETDLNIEEVIYKRPRPGNNLLLEFYAADGMRTARGVDHNVTGYIVRMTK